MSILINKFSKIIVQGFTGKEGSFHSQQMIDYGTPIIGGVTPGKGGKKFLGKPIFNTVEEAVKALNANVSIIFVPPRYAYDAIIESIDSGIKIIVCITEGIPRSDMIKIKNYINLKKKTILIGPNCPGIITPNEAKVGIMPGFIFKKGKVGIVSKSGTLTYEAADQIVKSGYGISTAIGIGGDPIIGTTMKYIISEFLNDSETDIIVIIGEIGGKLEIDAAKFLKLKKKKKICLSFIAGQTAPKGRTMGHAGAIIGHKNDTAFYKMEIMKKCGIFIVKSPSQIGENLMKISNF
ncbi:MAG: succinate--CoA ligase subunit alpha [Candidatus Karelsulcia muelleri]|uniref:succinate--CoA ligase subunit alpha n=1 Tax=Candidatus Karelsulcia muelleri TaxID=336810 RepID=UPI000D7BA695|nr:succinate--CoA ligase subunit alpha [Candidatus Karelsulcia muelleri]